MPCHICHLSLLNPVEHVRIYRKLARSQAKLGYQLSVWGQGEGPSRTDSVGIRLVPIGSFARLHWRRWLATWWMARRLRHERADVYVVHSPELLLLAWWLSIRQGACILYDVHEDYAANIRYGQHWPRFIRRWGHRMLRAWERWAIRHWVKGVSYAETCYENMLQASLQTYIVLENRALPLVEPLPLPSDAAPFLLYTGTIAEAWGLWEAIDLWEQWQEIEPMHLLVAGHTQQQALLHRLAARIARSPWSDRFQLIGGEQYVDHAQLMSLVATCHAGLGLYQDLPQIRGKMPTKFFEFMAHGKPLIFSPQPAWLARNLDTPFGLPWKAEDSVGELVASLQDWQRPTLPLEAYSWSSQESSLGDWLDRVLSGCPGERPVPDASESSQR